MERLLQRRTSTGAALLLGAGLMLPLTAAACGSAGSTTSGVDPGATVEAADSDESPPAPPSSEAPTATGDSTADPAGAADPDAPVLPVTVTDATGAEVTVDSIERIIPLDGTVAEVVFALGLGDRVVATDLSATHPPEADALPEIGYQRALSAEPIAAFEPTVLLATDIAGPPGTLDELRALGIPLVIVPNEATADGPGRKIRAVADALGVAGRGEELATEVDRAIAAASVAPDAEPADSPAAGRPRVAALYVRGDSAQMVLGRDAATHWLIEAAGGTDVADSLDLDAPTPITAEAILVADPEVLLVPSAGLTSAGGIDGLLEIDGLARTSAGQARRVLAYDDQLLLGNGPRVGELLADLRAELAELTELTEPDRP